MSSSLNSLPTTDMIYSFPFSNKTGNGIKKLEISHVRSLNALIITLNGDTPTHQVRTHPHGKDTPKYNMSGGDMSTQGEDTPT